MKTNTRTSARTASTARIRISGSTDFGFGAAVERGRRSGRGHGNLGLRLGAANIRVYSLGPAAEAAVREAMLKTPVASSLLGRLVRCGAGSAEDPREFSGLRWRGLRSGLREIVVGRSRRRRRRQRRLKELGELTFTRLLWRRLCGRRLRPGRIREDSGEFARVVLGRRRTSLRSRCGRSLENPSELTRVRGLGGRRRWSLRTEQAREFSLGGRCSDGRGSAIGAFEAGTEATCPGATGMAGGMNSFVNSPGSLLGGGDPAGGPEGGSTAAGNLPGSGVWGAGLLERTD